MKTKELSLDNRAMIDQFYRDGETWDQEIIGAAKRREHRGYIFGAVCLVVAALQATAIAIMVPLQRIAPPVYITLNEATGVVRALRTVEGDAALTADEAFIKSVLNTYVVARETWDRTDQADREEIVTLMTDGDAVGEYLDSVSKFNPNGLHKTLGALKRKVVVSRVAFLNSKTAHVEFVSADTTTPAPTIRTWAAVIKFDFVKSPSNERDLLLNPLGFKVQSYRRDATAVDPSVLEAGATPAGRAAEAAKSGRNGSNMSLSLSRAPAFAPGIAVQRGAVSVDEQPRMPEPPQPNIARPGRAAPTAPAVVN